MLTSGTGTSYSFPTACLTFGILASHLRATHNDQYRNLPALPKYEGTFMVATDLVSNLRTDNLDPSHCRSFHTRHASKRDTRPMQTPRGTIGSPAL